RARHHAGRTRIRACAQTGRSRRHAARPGSGQRRGRMGTFLRQAGPHHDTGRQACPTDRGGSHSYGRRTPSCGQRLAHTLCTSARTLARRSASPGHGHQRRHGTSDTPLPAAVSMELQPLQDSQRRSAAPRRHTVMTFSKLPLLRTVFAYFGRSSLPTRKRWARVLAWLAPRLLRSRAHIVRTNLALCFPERSEQERKTWLQTHFYLLALSIVDRGLCWFGPKDTILDTTPITGLEHLDALLKQERKIILLAPHFI